MPRDIWTLEDDKSAPSAGRPLHARGVGDGGERGPGQVPASSCPGQLAHSDSSCSPPPGLAPRGAPGGPGGGVSGGTLQVPLRLFLLVLTPDVLLCPPRHLPLSQPQTAPKARLVAAPHPGSTPGAAVSLHPPPQTDMGPGLPALPGESSPLPAATLPGMAPLSVSAAGAQVGAWGGSMPVDPRLRIEMGGEQRLTPARESAVKVQRRPPSGGRATSLESGLSGGLFPASPPPRADGLRLGLV